MKQFTTRAYNSLEVRENKGSIIKRSKKDRLLNEINYYKNLDPNSSLYFPRFLDSYKEEDYHCMELEYYTYENLGFYMVYNNFNEAMWLKVVKILNAMFTEFSKNYKTGSYSDMARSMYIDKTKFYYNDLVENFINFQKISKPKDVKINNKLYLNFDYIWDDIKKIIENELLSLEQIQVIHGDCCFSNILCGYNSHKDKCVIKGIDPRGKFGATGIYGDILYDSAKLLHSYEGGYEYMIFDEFNIDANLVKNEFGLSFSNNNKDKIKKVFDENANFDYRKSKIIQGLIFIGMCSRHYDSEKRQMAMYCQGIKFLNEVLDEK